MLETVIGCKWSMTVFHLLAQGVCRPGAMERAVEGLTAKVLGACLRRLVDLGILERTAYPEVPPRVEYRVTPFGQRFLGLLEHAEALQAEWETRHPTTASNVNTDPVHPS